MEVTLGSRGITGQTQSGCSGVRGSTTQGTDRVSGRSHGPSPVGPSSAKRLGEVSSTTTHAVPSVGNLDTQERTRGGSMSRWGP